MFEVDETLEIICVMLRNEDSVVFRSCLLGIFNTKEIAYLVE